MCIVPDVNDSRFQPIHGHTWRTSAGSAESPTYASWRSMKRRCTPSGKYGQKGISVCEQWRTFVGFLSDMGERPAGTTLDRIDGTGNYEPGNCRWATPTEQAQNRATNGRTCPAGCQCGRHRDHRCPAGCSCPRHSPPPRTPEWRSRTRDSLLAHHARVRAALSGATGGTR